MNFQHCQKLPTAHQEPQRSPKGAVGIREAMALCLPHPLPGISPAGVAVPPRSMASFLAPPAHS